jgi:hypothetical protein
MGVQTYAEASTLWDSTGDKFLKQNQFFSVKIPQISGRFQALLTYHSDAQAGIK